MKIVAAITGASGALYANAKGNAVAGGFYGPNHTTCTMSSMTNCIFLPSCGRRDDDKTVSYQNNVGHYWTGTEASSTNGWTLYFTVNSTGNKTSSDGKAGGMNIRCVQ